MLNKWEGMKNSSEVQSEIEHLRQSLREMEDSDDDEKLILILSRLHALEWVMNLPRRTQLSDSHIQSAIENGHRIPIS
jgi:hypothetical protein